MRTDTQHVTGALIGGTFGGVFVLADANTPLGDVAAAVFRIGAVGGLLGLYLAAARTRRHHARRPAGSWADTEDVNLFARRYWLIVAGELALTGIGLGALQALGAPHQANVAWIRADRRASLHRLSRCWRVGQQCRACGRGAGRIRSCRPRSGRRVRGGMDELRQRRALRVRSAVRQHLRTRHRASGQPSRRRSNVASSCPPDRERRAGRTGPRSRLSVLPRTSVRDPRTTDSVEDHVWSSDVLAAVTSNLRERVAYELAAARSAIASCYFGLWSPPNIAATLSDRDRPSTTCNVSPDARQTMTVADRGRRRGGG